MTDRRFFNRRGPFPLGEIARVVNAELPDLAAAAMMINDIDALDTAGIGDISVFNDLRYVDAFTRTRASVVVTSHELARHQPIGMRLLLTAQPRLAYAQIGHLFYPAASLTPGIDTSAQVDRTATIGPGSQVDAGAVIGSKVEVGARCHIGPHVVLRDGVVLGENCLIGANSVISYALIGDRVDISTCVSIGGPGFGFVPSRQGLLRVLQVGRVIIEDDVEIGANCAIDRGTTGDTVIGTGTVIDNLVQIGHNVRLGRNCVLSGQVGIAGSTVVGDGVMIGGQAAISDHLTIGAGARVAGKSGVMRDIEPGGSVGGYPAVPIRQWHRQTIGLMRLLNRKDT